MEEEAKPAAPAAPKKEAEKAKSAAVPKPATAPKPAAVAALKPAKVAPKEQSKSEFLGIGYNPDQPKSKSAFGGLFWMIIVVMEI